MQHLKEREFDINNIQKVDINEVKYNTWNPKQKRTKEYEKVFKSIEKNGSLAPIFVREIDDENFGYEIVDGAQRYTAMLDLSYPEVYIYNLGKITDEEGQALTLYLDQSVPFDDDMLGKLLSDLQRTVDLPYTDEEIALFSGIDISIEEDEDGDDFDITSKLKDFRIKITKNQYNEALNFFNVKNEELEHSFTSIFMTMIRESNNLEFKEENLQNAEDELIDE